MSLRTKLQRRKAERRARENPAGTKLCIRFIKGSKKERPEYVENLKALNPSSRKTDAMLRFYAAS